MNTESQIDTLALCHLCGKANDLKTVEVCNPPTPNTFTGYPEYGRVLWKCAHCGGWN